MQVMGTGVFSYGLLKIISKCNKSLQIKRLQAFVVGIKTPYWAPKRNKNERNLVRNSMVRH